MKEKQIALSIEQMKHLEELGCDTKNASMCFIKILNIGSDCYSLTINEECCHQYSCFNPIPTFSLQDIIELLPKEIEWKKDLDLFIKYVNVFGDYKPAHFKIDFENNRFEYEVYDWGDIPFTIPYVITEDGYIESDTESLRGDNLLDAAYKMLCWCLENGFINK